MAGDLIDMKNSIMVCGLQSGIQAPHTLPLASLSLNGILDFRAGGADLSSGRSSPEQTGQDEGFVYSDEVSKRRGHVPCFLGRVAAFGQYEERFVGVLGEEGEGEAGMTQMTEVMGVGIVGKRRDNWTSSSNGLKCTLY